MRLRQLLTTFTLCSTLFAYCAFAQSSLTQIQDTVYNPNGTPFNGTVVITWVNSSGAGGANPTPNSTSVKIYNGALSVMLAPSTTAVPPASYTAVYNSSDGLVTWSETWAVPPSTSPVTLSMVRQGSGGTTSQANIPISQVIGLTSYLNAFNGSLASLSSTVSDLSTTVNGLGSSVATLTTLVDNLNSAQSSPLFVDAETPTGTINGSNTVFNLSHTPSPVAALELYRNGVLQANGVDYTLSGNTVTFGSNSVPQSGDLMEAYYRIAGSGQAATFADNELPTGTIDGVNLTFALSAAPNPTLSLKLYKNGVLLMQNSDYTLSGSAITFVNQSVTPQPGDSISAYYRH